MSIDVLQAKIRKTKNPSMICIAPSVLELPMPIKDAARAQYGDTLRAAAETVRRCARRRMLTGRSRSAFSTRSRKRFRR